MFLRARLAERPIVGVAPTSILGTGTEAVGDLGTARVTDGLRLAACAVHTVRRRSS